MKEEIIKINYIKGKPANPKRLLVTLEYKKLALRRNHVKNGGYYMDVSDLPRYFALSERRDEIKEQANEFEQKPEGEEIKVPVKKVRRRKPAEG
jgi:hypothetical protein